MRALSKSVGHKLRDRVGIHVGEVFLEQGKTDGRIQNLSGIHVDTCARVMGACEPERTLLTRFAFDNAQQVLTGQKVAGLGQLQWLTHGLFELKGVARPLEICEVCERGLVVPSPLPDGEKIRRFVSAPVIDVATELPIAAEGSEKRKISRLRKEAFISFGVGCARRGGI